jgi:ABC-type transport system involved in multi-copper enzyme maturation permease subunit
MTATVLPWLIRDVFRRARATGLLAALLAVTALVTLVCLTATFHPDSATEGGKGRLTVLFGAVTVIENESREAAVHYLQFLLAGVVADTAGILLALVWTAGFLPSFLEAESASVLLAKPVSRSLLFVGQFFGVLVFVAALALGYVAATAVALALRTGVGGGGYWLSVPLLLLHFFVFYSFSALLAVMTRNTAACVVGSLLFWMACWAMNYGRHALAGIELSEVTAAAVRVADLGYWVLPKPADFGLILYDALGADRFTTPGVEFRRVQELGLFRPVASVLSSLAFGVAMLLLTVYEFVNEDY